MGRRRGCVVALLIVLALALAACVGGYLLFRRGFRRGQAVRPPDVASAKAAGDELLASRDATILVVAAHPDDAEWWIGGTMAMLSRHNRVVLVMGTSGEKGNAGLQPGLARTRERLQLEGAKTLGLADVVFLRQPDGRLAEAEGYPALVEDVVAKEDPSIVIAFDTEREAEGYRHPDHAAAGRAGLQAARAHGGVRLYLFHTAGPDTLVDYGPASELKMEALSTLTSYRDASPLALLVKLSRWVGIERSVITYGSRAYFPEVGVEFGELFRRDDSAMEGKTEG